VFSRSRRSRGRGQRGRALPAATQRSNWSGSGRRCASAINGAVDLLCNRMNRGDGEVRTSQAKRVVPKRGGGVTICHQNRASTAVVLAGSGERIRSSLAALWFGIWGKLRGARGLLTDTDMASYYGRNHREFMSGGTHYEQRSCA
jgi:hypothetical protein